MAARLLLADDSVTIQRVIELTFADEDIQVHAVGDGRAAIEHIQRERPDIVLADVGMPERDGYEVAAFLKGSPETADIPVLLLTGAFEPVDETRARAVGCAGVLVKPFEPQVVISRVKDLLAGRRPDGLWAKPSAQSPVRPAAAPAGAPGAPGASLEDYFDRLDAAFAQFEGATPPPVPASSAADGDAQVAQSEFAEDLAGLLPDSGRPAAAAMAAMPAATPQAPPPAATAPAPAPVAPAAESAAIQADAPGVPPPGATRIDVPSGAGPTLGEAFAALLAAEQGQPFAPAPQPRPPAPAPLPDAAVEAIVRRVVAEMSEHTVRETVLDVAERLVREEIARIKAAHPV